MRTPPDTPDPGAISFQYVPLIQCSFPHADQGELTTFTRRNGWLELTLSTARKDFGLPYGVPARLLTIYCASEAIRTRSPEIYLGESVNDFLRRSRCADYARRTRKPACLCQSAAQADPLRDLNR